MNAPIETLIDFDIVEFLLIGIISFIGAFSHEFMLFLNQNKRITVSVWVEILITTLVVTIVSLSVNPLVAKIHPRLILLPPLLMGLLGEELLNKLIHIDKSSKLFITVLKFLHIQVPEDVELPEADTVHNKNPERHKEILKDIVSIKVNIEETIVQFEETKDEHILLTGYKEINTSVALIKLKLREDPDVEDVVLTEFQDMLDRFADLTKMRKDAMADGHISKANEQSNETIVITNDHQSPMRLSSAGIDIETQRRALTEVTQQNKESAIKSESANNSNQ